MRDHDDASFSHAQSALLSILYQDNALIAVNKPAGLAVHRSKMVGNAEEFLIDLLREQVGDTTYLAHRLDRATSGVLLIARSREIAAALGEQFMGRDVLSNTSPSCAAGRSQRQH